jgi:predicted transposase YdaD
MAKIWDENMRALVRYDPQAFVDLVLPGAHYIKHKSEKLRNWQLEVDALLDAVICGEEILIHIEFQTYHDPKIAERLLRYNVLAQGEYQKPVRSYVIFLLKDGPVAPSPLLWTVPGYHGREEFLRFHYGCIEIAELTPEWILQTGQLALLPFLPLTKGGATQETVERMFAEMEPANNKNLEIIGFTLASMVLGRTKNTLGWDWLQERFKHMHDILRESPIYQLILQEGLQEGLQKGHLEGLQMQRQTIADIVQVRFPDLVTLAEQKAAQISDPTQLRHLSIKMVTAQDAEQARRLLLD